MARRLSSTQQGYGQAHRRARLVVLARDGWRCHWCGGPANEADHLGPKVPDPAQMVAACRSCNARRGLAKAMANRAARRALTLTHPTPTPPPTPSPGPSRRW